MLKFSLAFKFSDFELPREAAKPSSPEPFHSPSASAADAIKGRAASSAEAISCFFIAKSLWDNGEETAAGQTTARVRILTSHLEFGVNMCNPARDYALGAP